MAWSSTVIALSTTPVAIITTGTTWAHTRAATLYDPTPLVIANESTAIQVRIGGNALASGTTGAGLPLANGNLSFSLLASDPLFGWTTSSTGSITVMAGRQ